MYGEIEQLDTLARYHRWLAVFTALCACLPIVHVAVGISFLTSAGSMQGVEGGPNPALFGWLFVVMGSAFAVAGWVLAAAMFRAGRYLRERTHHDFCMVVAAVSCTVMPFGTIVGVLTLIALSKDSVRALFGVPGARAPGY